VRFVVIPNFPAMSPDRTVVASVAGFDDAVIVVIYRHVEPFVPDADLHLVVLSIEGDLGSDTACHLEPAVRQAIEGEAPVCCDLRSAGFFGAAGARVLLSAVQQASEADALFLVRGVRGMAGRVLAAVGFDPALIVQ
jgi:anti-anti-sigma factor